MKHLTPEEACEQHFIENTELIDNRFMVRLPFKKSVNLGDSLDQATRTFQYLEKRLNSNPDLRRRYQEILKLEHGRNSHGSKRLSSKQVLLPSASLRFQGRFYVHQTQGSFRRIGENYNRCFNQ